MPIPYRPDVYIQESSSSSFAPTASVQTTAVFVGPHMQGPVTNPILITSWQQFQAVYGGFGPGVPTYLSLAVFGYFMSGGGRCLVLRVPHLVGGGTFAATSSLIFKDTEGSPQNTITVSAISPGVWGQSIGIQIASPSDGVAGHFKIIVFYGGLTAASAKETWDNLSMNQWDSRYFASMINNINTGSAYISVVDMQGTTTVAGFAPQTVSAGYIGTGTGSTAGVDGAAPTDAEIVAALPLLNAYNGPLVLNLPGNSDTSAVGGAITYSQGRSISEDTFVVVDPPAPTQASYTSSQYATQLTGAAAAGLPATGGFIQNFSATDCAAVYAPWVLISDPSSATPGAVRLVPPGGFVVGAFAKSDGQAGPWKAPAGVRTGGLNAVAGLQYNFTNADLDNLNANNVNAIKAMPTAGCVIMGARTLSPLTAQRYVNVRRLMSYIEVTVQQTLQSALFESNDAVLWLQVSTTVGTFLQNLFAQGAFAGGDAASSYYVICDSSVNTAQTIAAGQLICQVGIAPVTPAEFILMQMSQWANGTTSSTTVSS